jgi:hypothetical protein
MEKQRHGCLTAWLVLVIVANTLTALAYVLGQSAVAANLPAGRGWVVPVLAVFAAANVIFAIALFQWRRWGFYGIVASSVVALVVNLLVGGGPFVITGLLGPLVLYGVLQIGGARKGWDQLE